MADPIDLDSRRPPPDAATEFIGPFERFHKVTSGGYRVPFLTAHPQNNGQIRLRLDERFEIDASVEEARRWVWFLANAMAVAAGYSCHGVNCRETNRYQVQMSGIGED